MSIPLLLRSCPACGDVYGDHDRDGLAACFESLVGDDWDDDPIAAAFAFGVPTRQVETITGPTLSLVLGATR